MKLLTFWSDGAKCLGCARSDGYVLNLTAAWHRYTHPMMDASAPSEVMDVIRGGPTVLSAIETLSSAAADDAGAPLLKEDEVHYLAPIPRPAKNIFCVGRNYRAHIIEGNIARGRDPNAFPEAIEFFTKPPTTVVGHRAGVLRHAHLTDMLDYEVELGVVIGKAGRDIREEDALGHVFGYTVINDITARDLQARHGQWFKGKSLDTSCPMGPVITLASAIPDPNNLQLELYVNGERRQCANTSDMLFSVAQIVAQLSQGLTLEPGDIIATGTPSGVGFALQPPSSLQPGDTVLAQIESIGELTNNII